MKGIYYQTTRVTHWNLQIIITANAIKWCDIFHLFVGWNKKRKPVMEGNCRLNINFEGHIAELYRLFRYFKNMWPFLLTLISLYKNIFLPSYCRMEITPVLSRKRRRFLYFTILNYFSSFLLSDVNSTCPFTEETSYLLMAKSDLPRKVFMMSL